jgi:hypothetical protein
MDAVHIIGSIASIILVPIFGFAFKMFMKIEGRLSRIEGFCAGRRRNCNEEPAIEG